MPLPTLDAYADLAVAGATKERGRRRRIAFLLWWPALALVIVLAEVFSGNGYEAIAGLALLWGALVAYSEWPRSEG